MKEIEKKLFSMQDITYKEFHQKLMPGIDTEAVIGIRTPHLRQFAAELSKTDEAKTFMNSLPHKFYEENNLHAFLIEKITDFSEAIYETERFLPYIDNWATCDSFLPKVFKKDREKLLCYIGKWLKSDETYTVRYAIGLLMKLFLDDGYFKPCYMEAVANIRSDEYYIKMMQAWYFQVGIVKQYDNAIKYLTEKRLDSWVHNKAIQKIRESRMVDKKIKELCSSLKITNGRL